MSMWECATRVGSADGATGSPSNSHAATTASPARIPSMVLHPSRTAAPSAPSAGPRGGREELMILDDRGQPVDQHPDPQGIYKPPDLRLQSSGSRRRFANDPRIRAVVMRRSVAEAWITSRTPPHQAINVIFAVVAAVVLAAFWYTAFTGGPPRGGAWVLVAIGAIALLGFGPGIKLFMRPHARARRQSVLEDLRNLPPHCAGCWYPLNDVPTASDGCTVCPECGAAWRLTTPSEPGS